MRGRRPKPTRLKVLTGNPGKRALNDGEPRPEIAIPDCPEELGETARREWNRLVGELAALKLLTNFDRASLAAYCGAYALWAEATQAIQKYGVMIKSPSGYPVQSPYVSYRFQSRMNRGDPQRKGLATAPADRQAILIRKRYQSRTARPRS
jgi:P27 family predicted phage terminase small subunit